MIPPISGKFATFRRVRQNAGFTPNMAAVGVVGDTVVNKGETIAKAIADVTANGSLVEVYANSKSIVTKIDLTKETSAVATGVYEYNSKNEVGDAVDASLLKSANAAEFKVDGSLIKVGTAYYNVTDETKAVFADADLGAIDGNYGYVVLTLKNGAPTTNVETIFIVSEKPF